MLRSRLRLWRPRGRQWLYVYLALLIASQLFIALSGRFAITPIANQRTIIVPAMDDDGPVRGLTSSLSVRRWSADPAAPWPDHDDAGQSGSLPVLLLHGSPGKADDFSTLAPMLAAPGRDVYAIDLPGFGRSDSWVPSYSILAHARAALAAMDELGLQRVHLVGWSMGGGVGLYMTNLAPSRVVSLSLLASVGVQEAEGSGDYHFEHAKYAAGYALLVVLPEFIPHFGMLGPRGARHAFIRNFWDTDQRPLRSVMEGIQTPTLIIHGRRDFLVPAWGAEESYRTIPSSRLVMLDATHFIPFLHESAAARHLIPFLARHDDPAAPPLRQVADFAPIPPEQRMTQGLGPFEIVRGTPWWLLILIIILATFLSEDATVIAVGILIAKGHIDAGVGFLGCLIGIAVGDGLLWSIGRFAGRPALHWPLVRKWLPEQAVERWGRAFDRHAIKAVFLARAIPGTRVPTYIAAGLLSRRAHRFLLCAALAALVWTPILLSLAAFLGPHLLRVMHTVFEGPWALLAALLLIFILVRLLALSTTRIGRRRIGVALRRPWRLEFWPPQIFYTPLGFYMVWLALRNRGAMSFTCMNPGVPHGGGVVGESKQLIIDGLTHAGAGRWIVATSLVRAGPSPAERSALVESIVRTNPAFGDYPVVLKPDESQRGHAFKLARGVHDVNRYFEDMTRDALVQSYHPGPEEAGILWARIPGRALDEPGEIFSITRKVFPVIEGDGVSSLEELIWAHPRFRMQARTFLKRFADQTDRILFKGEKLRLAVAGNHCQGTMFLDGADLITPELTRRIDEIARAFPHSSFDFGRFDVRYTTDDDLRRGEGFRIVELNAAMSESTNLYDPTKSWAWSYSVLFRQWRRMYELGAGRRRSGVRPMRLAELAEAIRNHYKGRPGSSVAD